MVPAATVASGQALFSPPGEQGDHPRVDGRSSDQAKVWLP